MSNEFTGTIVLIKESEQISEKFVKREFILSDDNDQYPQVISFELHQDKVDIILGCKPGDKVTVGFNLRGREWTDNVGNVRYFNTLQAWRVDKVASAKDSLQEALPFPADDGGIDDLPF